MAAVTGCPWSVADLDRLHAVVGMGREWRESERRRDLVAAEAGPRFTVWANCGKCGGPVDVANPQPCEESGICSPE